MLNADLYVAVNGCKWRGLPTRFGNWHTIYTRLNRWAKAGVLERVFQALQEDQLVKIDVEAFSPDGTGSLIKLSAVHRKAPRRMNHQDQSQRGRRANGGEYHPVTGPSSQRAHGACPDEYCDATRIVATLVD